MNATATARETDLDICRATVANVRYRMTEHGHTDETTMGPASGVRSTVDQVRPSKLGLPNAYAKKGFFVRVSTHNYTFGPDWISTVHGEGIAIVDGLLTLTAERIGPGWYRATWVAQGVGTSLRVAAGWIKGGEHILRGQ